MTDLAERYGVVSTRRRRTVGVVGVALVLAVVAGICTTLWLRQRTRRAMRMEPDEATGSGDTATTSSRR